MPTGGDTERRCFFVPGTAEKFAAWAGTHPNSPFGDCSLAGVTALASSLHFRFECPDKHELSVVAAIAMPSAEGAKSGPDEWIAWSAAGTLQKSREDAVLASLRHIAGQILDAVPSAGLLGDGQLVPSRQVQCTIFQRVGIAATASKTASGVVGWLHHPAFTRLFRDPYMLAAVALTAFVLSVAFGAFGYASANRSDWPALVMFGIALVARELLAPHSLSETSVHLPYGASSDSHGILYFLFGKCFVETFDDGYAAAMHANALMGAAAVLPLYLFVRQRTESRAAGLLVALAYSVNPVLIRFGPTDSPYSFILATWFAGLALLSAPTPGSLQILAGGTLLGMAGTGRLEGTLFILASIPLLGMRRVGRILSTHPAATGTAFLAVVALVILQFGFTARSLASPPPTPISFPTLAAQLPSILGGPRASAFVLGPLAAVACLASFLDQRCRLGGAAVLAAAVVYVPFLELEKIVGMLAGRLMPTPTIGSTFELDGTVSPFLLHRLVPAYAMQSVAAGVGAWALLILLRRRLPLWQAAAISAGAVLLIGMLDRGLLDEQWAAAVQYDLLRGHLGPRSADRTSGLLTASEGWDGAPYFAQFLRNRPIERCTPEDCASRACAHGFRYYYRGWTCFPGQQDARGRDADCESDPARCLKPECRRIESSMTLREIDKRVVFPARFFGEEQGGGELPKVATIALFEILGGTCKSAALSIPPK